MNRIWLTMGILVIGVTVSQASEFERLESDFSGTTWLLNPQYKVSPSGKVREAIDNGIVVNFVMQVKLYASKDWWFDSMLEHQAQTFAVRYFSLSSQYQLNNLRTKEKQSFITLDQLLDHLGQQTVFEFNANQDADYLSTRLFLDKQALPSTMQLPIVFDADWNLNTDWQQAPLNTGNQP